MAQQFDFAVVGAGICGSTAALYLAKKNPKASILVLEERSFGNAASTKNAGFACFGSAGELLDDVSALGWDATEKMLQMRIRGLELLHATVPKNAMDYQDCGGWEVFSKQESEDFTRVADQLETINQRFETLLPAPYRIQQSHAGLKSIAHAIFQAGEGALNPQRMMHCIQSQWPADRVHLVRPCKLVETQFANGVHHLQTSQGDFKAQQLVVTTNQNILPNTLKNKSTQPARAQVLVSQPLKGPLPKGVFHAERGYAYFRFVDQRLLLGGFRNLFEAAEYTTEQSNTPELLNQLMHYGAGLLGEPITLDHAWAGTMSVGKDRFPYIGVENDIVYGIKMGGMGVAVGSYVGKTISDLCA